MSGAPRLSDRALNRALLERQFLLRRARVPVLDAVERLAGLQAQVPADPYVALWSRLHAFRFEDLGELLRRREVVRAGLLRGTIHLASAADALAWRPALQPVLEREIYPNVTYGKEKLAGLDAPAVLEAGRALCEERPRTAAQLRDLLGPRWPERDPAALAHAVRCLVPLVHVPPRGVWGVTGPIAFAPMESWLGKPLAEHAVPDALMLRYLAAFGPATVADAATWSGLRGLREVFERLRPRLRTFADERGRELFDLPDAPRPDPDLPAPPRFLPTYDNLLLSHADRGRVVSDDDRKALWGGVRNLPGSVLVDGFVAGTWALERSGEGAVLTVRPFRRWRVRDTHAVESAGRRLVAALAGDGAHEVRVVRA